MANDKGANGSGTDELQLLAQNNERLAQHNERLQGEVTALAQELARCREELASARRELHRLRGKASGAGRSPEAMSTMASRLRDALRE